MLTINVFGLLDKVGEKLIENEWNGPYIVGEYGARGWWEAPKTKWRAPLDQSSNRKAEFIRTRYEKTVKGDRDRCLGSYVLYWGQRFEQTSTWFSLFTNSGEKTAVVDMVHYLWTGKTVPNQAPRLSTMRLGGKPAWKSVFLRPGKNYLATVMATDPERDSLRIVWELVPDVDENYILPQHRTALEPIPNAIVQAKGTRAVVKAPTKKGAYRLLVMAYDGQGSVATHSYPFYVGKLTAAEIEAMKHGNFKKKTPGVDK